MRRGKGHLRITEDVDKTKEPKAKQEMIKAETSINAGILAVLSSIPLVAEYVTARPGNVPGTGFKVLCYEPFDYAYFLMALMILVFANAIYPKNVQENLTQEQLKQLKRIIEEEYHEG